MILIIIKLKYNSTISQLLGKNTTVNFANNHISSLQHEMGTQRDECS